MSRFAKGDGAAAGMGINKIKDKTTEAISDSLADESYNPPVIKNSLDAGVSDVTNNFLPQPFAIQNHPEYDRGTENKKKNYINTTTQEAEAVKKEGRALSYEEAQKIRKEIQDDNNSTTTTADPVGSDRQPGFEENLNLYTAHHPEKIASGDVTKKLKELNTGDAAEAEKIYQESLTPQDAYRSIFKKNPLLDYDTVTYHFTLSMLTDQDAKSASNHIIKGNFENNDFRLWTPKNKTAVIAETGSTVLSINSVEILATVGPTQGGKRLSGAVEFNLNILQPLNASLTDTLVNSAITLGIPDGLKASYLLELHFIGRDPNTSKIERIENTDRQFLIEIVSVQANVDTNGAQYVIRAARAGDKGIRSDHYKTDRPLQLNNLKTVKDMMQSVQDTMNLNEVDKLAIEKGILDEYYISMDPYTAKILRDDPLIDTDTLNNTTYDQVEGVEYDTSKKMFRIPEGTSLDRIFEFGLSHSKKLQKLAKGLKDAADPDSSDSKEVDKYTKYIFRIKVDTKNIDWDIIRNDYAREFHYTISLYPTIRPEILPGVWNDSKQVAKEKMKDLLSGNLGKDKSRPYKALSKRYDYLFTGLNDKVLRFDIKYNNYFFFALHSYRSVFAGLGEIAKPKIQKSSKLLLEYQAQQQTVNAKWKQYTQKKADTILEEDPDLSSEFDEFKKERQKLIDLYVEGVEDGTFEGDVSIARTLKYANAEVYQDKIMRDNTDPNSARNSIKNKTVNQPQEITSDDGFASNDPNIDNRGKQLYSELIKREDVINTIDKSEKPFQIMWGAVPEAYRNNFNKGNGSPGKGHFDSVLEATLSDYSADMVHMDMDIRGDPFWLEGERTLYSKNDISATYFEGENYLLFKAITSAGEPDPKTGIARPGDEQQEQMLNGVYAVTQVTNRFESGQFIQNIKGVKEAFITDISILDKKES